MNTSRSILLSAVVIVFAGVGGWYVLSQHPVKGGISAQHASSTVAMVNGTAISQSQLSSIEAQMAAQHGATSTPVGVGNSQYQAAALDVLIGQTLITQAVQQSGVTASSTAVDAQLASITSHFKTQAAYQQALAAQGLTAATLRAQISEKLATTDFLNQQLNLANATATAADIQTAYQTISKTQSNVPPLAKIRSQIAQLVVQQKQQKAVADYVAQLRAKANVQIFIASTTPVAATSTVK